MVMKKIGAAFVLAGVITSANADVCTIAPGTTTCGKGTVNSLTGNGIVLVHGTTVEGPTQVNGILTAEDANFSTLNSNGAVSLSHCVIRLGAEIKGSLKASSTQFESSADIYSNSVQLNNTKVKNNLHIHHTDSGKQEVHLDNASEIGGDVIFDDGKGEVYLGKNSKILGNVTGGTIVNK